MLPRSALQLLCVTWMLLVIGAYTQPEDATRLVKVVSARHRISRSPNEASEGLSTGEVSAPQERGIEERREHDWFALRAYGAHTRYHKAKGSWMAFSEAGDAFVTHNWAEAARLYFDGDNLKSGKRWVTFHFSNGYTVWKLGSHRPENHQWRFWRDSWGWLHIGGYSGSKGWGVGWGEGVTCVSDDGSFFVEGDRHAPFKCRPVDLCNGHSEHMSNDIAFFNSHIQIPISHHLHTRQIALIHRQQKQRNLTRRHTRQRKQIHHPRPRASIAQHRTSLQHP